MAKAYQWVSTDTGEQRLQLEHPEQFNTGVLCFDSSEATRAFLDRWFETVLGQDPTDMWPGHNCDQTWFNRLVVEGVPQECEMSMTVLPNREYARGAMVEELQRRGLWDDVRIFHHRTCAMKARKALYP